MGTGLIHIVHFGQVDLVYPFFQLGGFAFPDPIRQPVGNGGLMDPAKESKDDPVFRLDGLEQTLSLFPNSALW